MWGKQQKPKNIYKSKLRRTKRSKKKSRLETLATKSTLLRLRRTLELTVSPGSSRNTMRRLKLLTIRLPTGCQRRMPITFKTISQLWLSKLKSIWSKSLKKLPIEKRLSTLKSIKKWLKATWRRKKLSGNSLKKSCKVIFNCLNLIQISKNLLFSSSLC